MDLNSMKFKDGLFTFNEDGLKMLKETIDAVQIAFNKVNILKDFVKQNSLEKRIQSEIVKVPDEINAIENDVQPVNMRAIEERNHRFTKGLRCVPSSALLSKHISPEEYNSANQLISRDLNHHEENTSEDSLKVFFSIKYKRVTEHQLKELLEKRGFLNFSLKIDNFKTHTTGVIMFSQKEDVDRAVMLNNKLFLHKEPLLLYNYKSKGEEMLACKLNKDFSEKLNSQEEMVNTDSLSLNVHRNFQHIDSCSNVLPISDADNNEINASYYFSEEPERLSVESSVFSNNPGSTRNFQLISNIETEKERVGVNGGIFNEIKSFSVSKNNNSNYHQSMQEQYNSCIRDSEARANEMNRSINSFDSSFHNEIKTMGPSMDCSNISIEQILLPETYDNKGKENSFHLISIPITNRSQMSLPCSNPKPYNSDRNHNLSQEAIGKSPQNNSQIKPLMAIKWYSLNHGLDNDIRYDSPNEPLPNPTCISISSSNFAERATKQSSKKRKKSQRKLKQSNTQTQKNSQKKWKSMKKLRKKNTEKKKQQNMRNLSKTCKKTVPKRIK